jgi:hypothetical protein
VAFIGEEASALADVGVGKAKWLARLSPCGRPARDSHASVVSKSATPPQVLGKVPAKFPRELTHLMGDRP